MYRAAILDCEQLAIEVNLADDVFKKMCVCLGLFYYTCEEVLAGPHRAFED